MCSGPRTRPRRCYPGGLRRPAEHEYRPGRYRPEYTKDGHVIVPRNWPACVDVRPRARIAFLRVIGTNSRCEEVADRRRDLLGMCFQREVAGVEEAHDGTRNIALERFRARRQEERVVLAPHREERRPM